MSERRVGTVTLGISLITFGILFLLRVFSIGISYTLIIKLWPLMFVFLGLEILIPYVFKKEMKVRYDFGSFLILALLTCFAMAMGVLEIFFEYYGTGTIIL